MPDRPAVLILAGSAEARALLDALAPLAAADRLQPIASLAGRTRAPRPLPAETRSGGFGGPEGLADWLRARGIAAVVDATHPFAARISANARLACEAAGVPRLQLLRPGWDGPARRFPTLRDALAAVPSGARVLAATGRASAPDLAGRPDLDLHLRVAEPGPPIPGLPDLRVLVARPPHGAAAERALMARLRITHLVARDSGGADGAKFAAAAALGIAVHLAARPAPEPGPVLASAPEAAAWLRAALSLA